MTGAFYTNCGGGPLDDEAVEVIFGELLGIQEAGVKAPRAPSVDEVARAAIEAVVEIGERKLGEQNTKASPAVYARERRLRMRLGDVLKILDKKYGDGEFALMGKL